MSPTTVRRQTVRLMWWALAGLAGIVACLTVGVFAQTGWKPATFRDGMPPVVRFQAVGGGEVFVEATVTDAGQVGNLTTLRATPPFTQDVLEAVRAWRFQPAEQMIPNAPGDPRSIVTGAVESKVMIACVFRPPTLNTPTLGVPPTDVQPATDDVAAPLTTVTPPYPPLALSSGTVIVQVTVGIDGRVVGATIVRSGQGFDESALAAARQWTFRPARIHGRLEETFAYIVFAFRQPIT